MPTDVRRELANREEDCQREQHDRERFGPGLLDDEERSGREQEEQTGAHGDAPGTAAHDQHRGQRRGRQQRKADVSQEHPWQDQKQAEWRVQEAETQQVSVLQGGCIEARSWSIDVRHVHGVRVPAREERSSRGLLEMPDIIRRVGGKGNHPQAAEQIARDRHSGPPVPAALDGDGGQSRGPRREDRQAEWEQCVRRLQGIARSRRPDEEQPDLDHQCGSQGERDVAFADRRPVRRHDPRDARQEGERQQQDGSVAEGAEVQLDGEPQQERGEHEQPREWPPVTPFVECDHSSVSPTRRKVAW